MRLKNLDYSDMNQEQKKIHDDIASGPRGSVRGPLAVWMHRAGLADKAQSLGAYCRYSSSLEPLLSEFAICLIARIWGSGYEWKVHSKIAIDAGVNEDMIESISLGKKPNHMSDEQHAVYEFTMTLNRDRKISDELTPKVFKSFPKEGIDLEWYKYKWKTYPYQDQKEKFGERWHEDGL